MDPFRRILFPNWFQNRKSLRLRVSWREAAAMRGAGKYGSIFGGSSRRHARALPRLPDSARPANGDLGGALGC